MFKKACPEGLSEGSVQTSPERGRREGRSPFDARSLRFVRERERREERQVCEPEGGKMAAPGLASRSGKARECRGRPFDQTQDRLPMRLSSPHYYAVDLRYCLAILAKWYCSSYGTWGCHMRKMIFNHLAPKARNAWLCRCPRARQC